VLPPRLGGTHPQPPGQLPDLRGPEQVVGVRLHDRSAYWPPPKRCRCGMGEHTTSGGCGTCVWPEALAPVCPGPGQTTCWAPTPDCTTGPSVPGADRAGPGRGMPNGCDYVASRTGSKPVDIDD